MYHLLMPFFCFIFCYCSQLTSYTPNNIPVQKALFLKSTQSSVKKILFINPWYVGGGMGTALVSLINNFPDPEVQIDICVQRKAGIYFSQILRKKVHIIEFEKAQSNQYDTIVCYAQWMMPHVWVDKFHGKKKVLWIHGDTSTGNWVEHLKKEHTLAEKIDAFVCVSDAAAKSFREALPRFKSKTHAIYNIVDNDKIKRQSLEPQNDMKRKNDLPIMLTVSRLAKDKGLEESIKAHALLEKEGVHFLWYIVGEGNRRPILEELIHTYHMEDKFILLGFKSNPYCYMKAADLVSLFSKAEGFCLVVAEAKILQKPIIVSNFTTAFEQITSGKNGLIVDNSISAMCKGIKELLQDSAKRARFSAALQGFTCNNSKSYTKIQEVLLSP